MDFSISTSLLSFFLLFCCQSCQRVSILLDDPATRPSNSHKRWFAIAVAMMTGYPPGTQSDLGTVPERSHGTSFSQPSQWCWTCSTRQAGPQEKGRGEEEAFPVGNGWKWLVLGSIDLGCLLHENSAAGWTWHRVWLMSVPQVLVVRCVDFPSDAGLSNKSRG